MAAVAAAVAVHPEAEVEEKVSTSSTVVAPSTEAVGEDAIYREPNTMSQVSPIGEIVMSNKRKHLSLSTADVEILEQLKRNPPPPSPQLIQMLRDSIELDR